ncbi:MAG: hypothetical protein IPJ34_09110 [Myxococcales bacterium]|nr:hypothetical protein [Myxococcales bacterium]
MAEHEDDDDPITPIKEMLADEEERPYTVVWPLSVARRFVRALGLPIKYVEPKDAASVLKSGAPVTADEARILLTQAVNRVGYNDQELMVHLVLLLSRPWWAPRWSSMPPSARSKRFLRLLGRSATATLAM